MVRYGTVLCGRVRYGTLRCGAVWGFAVGGVGFYSFGRLYLLTRRLTACRHSILVYIDYDDKDFR